MNSRPKTRARDDKVKELRHYLPFIVSSSPCSSAKTFRWLRSPRLASAARRAISRKPTTEAEVVEAVEFARSQGVPLFVLGGGSNLVVADAGFRRPGAENRNRQGCAPRQHLHRRSRLRLGRAGRADRRPRLRRAGMSQRNSRHRRRNSGAERRSVWAGCFRDHRRSSRARPALARNQNSEQRGMRLCLSLQHLQHERARPLHHPARVLRAATRRRAAHPLRRSGETFCRSAPALPHCQRCATRFARSATAKRCSSCRARKMRAAPDRSSRIRLSRNRSSTNYPPVCSRKASSCRAIPLGTATANFPRHGWSSTRDLPRATRKGAAGISHKHALAIVNRGGATAADILALKDEIQASVLDRFGIKLESEPVMVGFDEVPSAGGR